MFLSTFRDLENDDLLHLFLFMLCVWFSGKQRKSAQESLAVEGCSLVDVRKNFKIRQKHRKLQCRPELSEQCRRKTDAMHTPARMRAHVSDDMSGRKRFFFSYSLCDSFALWCFVEKKTTNKLLGLKKLDSCSFLGTFHVQRTSAVINQAKFGDMQGFTCKIARHPTFMFSDTCRI